MNKEFLDFPLESLIFKLVEYIGVALPFGWRWLGKEPRVEADPKSALTAVAKVPAPYQQGFLRRFQMYFCRGAKLDFLPFLFPRRTVSHCLGRAVGRQAAAESRHEILTKLHCLPSLNLSPPLSAISLSIFIFIKNHLPFIYQHHTLQSSSSPSKSSSNVKTCKNIKCILHHDKMVTNKYIYDI